MLKAKFSSNFAKLTLVGCYVPTHEAEVKYPCHDQFQTVIEDIKYDLLLSIGDIDTRIGSSNRDRE